MRNPIIEIALIVVSLNCTSQVVDSIKINHEQYGVSYNGLRSETMDGEALISEMEDTIVIKTIQWDLRKDSIFKVKATDWFYANDSQYLKNSPFRKKEISHKLFCSDCTDSIYILTGNREIYNGDTLPYPLKINLRFENGLLKASDTNYIDIKQVKVSNDKIQAWNQIQDSIFSTIMDCLPKNEPIEDDRYLLEFKSGTISKVKVIPHFYNGEIYIQDIYERRASKRVLKCLKTYDFRELLGQDNLVIDLYLSFDYKSKKYTIENTIPELIFYKINANKTK